MLQRLSLARALAVHPKVLILDEPFSALDPRTKADLKNLILHLQDKAHFCLVVVLHNLQDAYSLTERAIVLDGVPACVSLQANIKDLEFPEFQEKVLAAMNSSQIREDVFPEMQTFTKGPMFNPDRPKSQAANEPWF
jgi:ABC-type nitrate/sulfonate/bicarbonate transport system ATPase subunit